MDPYLDALHQIPPGETRSFMELAAMAGRPGAARAAGRAIAACRTTSKIPWHRVVSSDGRPRDAAQLRRLRRERARPRAHETVAEWASRTEARYIGSYRTRQFARRGDERTMRWNVEQVEAFGSESSALARGFSPIGSEHNREETLPGLPHTRSAVPETNTRTLHQRCQDFDWRMVRHELEGDGVCRLPALITPAECARILNESHAIGRFDRSVDMLPRGYGVGSYHYYREPLPAPAHALRDLLYRELAPDGFPDELSAFWSRCREAGQKRASSILIGYGKGGVNHPHRDVYGPVLFPFQALISLTKRGRDFTGGEFYVSDEDDTGNTKRIPVDEGDVVLFATRHRYRSGRKVPLRHGMTLVTKGTRYGVGVVFHLAE